MIMEKKIITKKELIKVIERMPLKIQTEFLNVMMEKYHTIDYNDVPLHVLIDEFNIIMKRRESQMVDLLTSIFTNLKIILN